MGNIEIHRFFLLCHKNVNFKKGEESNLSFSQEIREMQFIKGVSQIILYHYISTILIYCKPIY